jgi:hypothetical protein
MTCQQQLEQRLLIIKKTSRYASKQIFSSKEHKLYMKEALTSNIGQLSSQAFVFLLHCKVVLAHIGEIFDNRLHQRYQKNQHTTLD